MSEMVLGAGNICVNYNNNVKNKNNNYLCGGAWKTVIIANHNE